MENIIKNIYEQAKALGACDLFTGQEKTVDDIVKLFLSTKGMEFCQRNHFPNLATFRLFKGYGVQKYGIYIDAGSITLRNPKRAILVGRTVANIRCDTLERHEVYLFQAACATINASGWSVVSVQGVRGTQVIKNVAEHAIIL